MTPGQAFIYGMVGGCTAVFAFWTLAAIVLWWLVHRAPFQPEEEFINDRLAATRYRNGRSLQEEES